MIRQLTLDEIQKYIKDDTVRPHLTADYRNTQGRQVWALFEDQYAQEHEPSSKPLAIICVAYTNCAPINETELHWYSAASGEGAVTTDTAVFYTVWSYERGAGREIVNRVAEHIRSTRPEVERWVTLSPLTDMAEKFHLKNGAVLEKRYDTCQVFDYTARLTEAVECKQ
jgi:DICT domain-containing protein